MWLQWYKSPTAWVIIITMVVAMVEAFLLAYYLPYPWNLIGAIACCVASGIVIRKVVVRKISEEVQAEKAKELKG